MQPTRTSFKSTADSDIFYDPSGRQEAAPTRVIVHPPTVPAQLTTPSRPDTGPSPTTVSMQLDILDQPQQVNSTSKQSDITSQTSSRLAPLREQLNPPTSPALNISSPATSVRSTKVEAHTPFPPRSVLLKLTEIYFTHVNNQTYGFLHRPTFLRHIEEGKVPDSLLYSICAISARFSTTHAPPSLSRRPSDKESPAYHAGEPYAVEARKLALRDFDKPTVQNVQTLLLLALHDFGAKKGHKAWMFAGMAIRMASALRLNREVDGDAIGRESTSAGAEIKDTFRYNDPRTSPKEGVSWIEREIRRRTFWACFIMDVYYRL
jgi:Fungal specific transcription factor domain